MFTQAIAAATAFTFSLLKTLTQLIAEVIVAVEHAGRVVVAEVSATLHHFCQRKGLLTCVALLLLRLLIICLSLLVLFRIALQYRDDRFQFRQLRAMLMQEARRVLCRIDLLTDLFAAIAQRIVQQQVDAWQQSV